MGHLADVRLKSRRRIGALAGLALVTCSPSVAAAGAGDALAAIKSIGVIACLGDTAEVRLIGVTVFGNRSSDLPIADWDLDGRLAADAAKALSPRFRVDLAPLPSETLDDVKSASCRFVVRRLREAIKAGTAPGVDTYLLFLSSSEALPYPSNQQVTGPGVYRRTSLFSRSGYGDVVHLTYEADLIDGHTAKLLKYHRAELARGESQSGVKALLAMAITAPTPEETLDVDWPATASAFSSEQKAALRDHLENLADRSVTPTLAKMGLNAPP